MPPVENTVYMGIRQLNYTPVEKVNQYVHGYQTRTFILLEKITNGNHFIPEKDLRYHSEN